MKASTLIKAIWPAQRTVSVDRTDANCPLAFSSKSSSHSPPNPPFTNTFHFDQQVAQESVYYFITPAVRLLFSNKTMKLCNQIAHETNVTSQMQCFRLSWQQWISLGKKPGFRLHMILTWKGDRNNTKNWEILFSLKTLNLSVCSKDRKRKKQAFLSQFPQINSVQMKSGNINRPENLGCAPLALKMCLSSLKQYLVRERADSTRSESARSTGNRAQMAVRGCVFLFFIRSISGQVLSSFGLRLSKTSKIWLSCKTQKMSKERSMTLWHFVL